MKVYTLCQIGQFHTDQNEDSLKVARIGSNQLLISIFDGCSSGIESHFSSTLFTKIVSKIAKDQYFKEFATNKRESNSKLLETTLKSIFNRCKEYKANLDLDKLELLSTIILGIVNTEENSASIIVVGDGIISYDTNIIEFENDNKPDYLAYHLEENVEKWYLDQTQKLDIETFSDLSIMSDGIFTFKELNSYKEASISENEIVEFLLNNSDGEENEMMLKKKTITLKDNFNIAPTDDLSIIRLIKKQ